MGTDAHNKKSKAGKTKSGKLSAIGILAPFALRHRAAIGIACVALLTASAAMLALPIAVRRVIDHGFSSADGTLVNAYFFMLAGVVTVLALASATRFYFVTMIGERVAAGLRTAVFEHLERLEPAFFDRTHTGELTSRLSADTTAIKSAFGSSISQALRNIVLFIGAAVMMAITSPSLSVLVLMAIPVIVIPLVLSGRSVRKRSRAAQDKLAMANTVAMEAIGAIRTVQAFGAEEPVARRFANAVNETFAAARESTMARAVLTAAGLFLISSSIVAVLWYGAQEVLAGTMTGGRLSQFVLYAVLAASALGELSQVWGEVQQALGAAERLGEILATQPRIQSPETPQLLPEPSRGEVSFKNVRFSYAGPNHAAALQNISLTIAAGEKVAFVGPSGAGKSTIFQLLMRFYDPDEGHISIDGIDATQIELAALRRRLAIVQQDPVIFSASIADNIRYGNADASDEEMREAARLAAAHDFISALPQGYDTLAGERGVTLSGGQRQRLAIARAVLKNAPILLLDEATSALDAENERLVQEALDRLVQNRTTLIIAHRLSTIMHADRIMVMEAGRIAEEGTHASLIAGGGLYAKFARLQSVDSMARSSAGAWDDRAADDQKDVFGDAAGQSGVSSGPPV